MARGKDLITIQDSVKYKVRFMCIRRQGLIVDEIAHNPVTSQMYLTF